MRGQVVLQSSSSPWLCPFRHIQGPAFSSAARHRQLCTVRIHLQITFEANSLIFLSTSVLFLQHASNFHMTDTGLYSLAFAGDSLASS